jgi:hypothetical protein
MNQLRLGEPCWKLPRDGYKNDTMFQEIIVENAQKICGE